MIPPFQDVIDRARATCARAAASASWTSSTPALPSDAWLTRSHVFLGAERLDALRAAFPSHRVRLRNAFGWRFYQFVAEADRDHAHKRLASS